MTPNRWILLLTTLSVCLSNSVALDRPYVGAQNGTLPRAQDAVSFNHARLIDFIATMSQRVGIAAVLIDKETLQGFVTLHKDAPVSKQDMLDMFVAGLRDNGAMLVKSGTVYQIVPLSRGLGEGVEAITSATAILPFSRYSGVQMKFDGISVSQFCAVIADMYATTPIVISPAIKGGVTLYSSAAITREDAYAIWRTVLKNNGAMLIGSSGRYEIVPVSQNLDPGWNVITDQPPPPMAYGMRRQRRSVRPEELESHIITRIDPILRQAAGQPKLTGKVVVGIALNEQGELDIVHVYTPAMPPLDEAAIEAVKQWRFKPFIGSDGLPERIEGLVTIVFN